MTGLPDFLVIGAMKAGTTTLFRWLGEHPGVWVPPVKEPHFFARDETWMRGVDWYCGVFAGCPAGAITGEASTSSTAPASAEKAAARARMTVPDARLVYLVREPEERLRSHYRHEVLRGREKRSLRAAVADPDSPYVGHSLYSRCAAPWIDKFGLPSLVVVRLDDLARENDHAGWFAVLDHLGLAAVDPPESVANVSADRAAFTPLMRRVWDRGLVRPLTKLPAPVRRAGRRIAVRRGAPVDAAIRASQEQVPSAVVERLRGDAAAFAEMLGRPPLWTY